MVQFSISHVANNDSLMTVLAGWSVIEWERDFPDDTIDTYLDLYRRAVATGNELPCVFVATTNDGEPIGTVTLIEDDELPNALEPGPWLAALFVPPQFRQHGVGTALTKAVLNHARKLNYPAVYLYTEDKMPWYESLGWEKVRTSELSGHEVTVMKIRI